MLTALSCRGPDSAGIALWGSGEDGLVARVKLGDGGDLEARRREILGRARRATRVLASSVQGALLRLVVAKTDPVELAAAIESVAPDVEVVSMGQRLEIVKQVGAPGGLDADVRRRRRGAAATGSGTRACRRRAGSTSPTPSRSGPTGRPISPPSTTGTSRNYHRLRRIYEQEGVRFYTENDSEVIGVYLADQLAARPDAGRGARGLARGPRRQLHLPRRDRRRDRLRQGPLRLKPLIVAESAGAVAIANEEIAIQAALGGRYRAREAAGRRPPAVGARRPRAGAARAPRAPGRVR